MLQQVLGRRFLAGLLAGAVTAKPVAALADMFPDAANAKKPEAQINLGIIPDAKAYGAVGNGTTDDTAALNAMAEAARAAGQPWHIPAGTYRITGPVTVYTSGVCDGVIVLEALGQAWPAVTVAPDPADVTAITAATINAWTGLTKGNAASADFAPYYGRSVFLYSPDENILNRRNLTGMAYQDSFTVDDPAGYISPPINQTKTLTWTNTNSFSVLNRPTLTIDNLSVRFTGGTTESYGGISVTRPNTTLRAPSVINLSGVKVQIGILTNNTANVSIYDGFVQGVDENVTNYGYDINNTSKVALINCRELFCRRGIDFAGASKQALVSGGSYPDGIGGHWVRGLRIRDSYLGCDAPNSAAVWVSGGDIVVEDNEIHVNSDAHMAMGVRPDFLSLEGEFRLENNRIHLHCAADAVTKYLLSVGAGAVTSGWDYGRSLFTPSRITLTGNTVYQHGAGWTGDLYLLDILGGSSMTNPLGVTGGGEIEIERNVFALDAGVARLWFGLNRRAEWVTGFGSEGRGYRVWVRDVPALSVLAFCAPAVAVPANLRGDWDIEASGALTWAANYGAFRRALLRSGSMTGTLGAGRPGSGLATPVGDENELWQQLGNEAAAIPTSSTAFFLGVNFNGRVLELTAATAVTVTVPANATTPLPVGYTVDLVQVGAGQATIASAGGVTVRGYPGAKTAGQYARIRAAKTAADTWSLSGALAA